MGRPLSCHWVAVNPNLGRLGLGSATVRYGHAQPAAHPPGQPRQKCHSSWTGGETAPERPRVAHHAQWTGGRAGPSRPCRPQPDSLLRDSGKLRWDQDQENVSFSLSRALGPPNPRSWPHMGVTLVSTHHSLLPVTPPGRAQPAGLMKTSQQAAPGRRVFSELPPPCRCPQSSGVSNPTALCVGGGCCALQCAPCGTMPISAPVPAQGGPAQQSCQTGMRSRLGMCCEVERGLNPDPESPDSECPERRKPEARSADSQERGGSRPRAAGQKRPVGRNSRGLRPESLSQDSGSGGQ